MFMTKSKTSLTGIWHGLYSYPSFLQPVYFVATLIQHGQGFSGSIHEAVEGAAGAPLTVFASVDGSLSAPTLNFKKAYDGTGGWEHIVNYEGDLNADFNEIEGVWSIPASWSGRFLMIRGEGVTEQLARQIYENVN